MPLGFDFNKQFKSHYLQSNILLMLQAVLFFYAGTQLTNPEVLVAFSKPISIQQTQTTNFLLLLQTGCCHTGNSYIPKFVRTVW